MNKRVAFSQYRPHPWHGLSAGPQPPRRLHAFIEITPFDLIKYEIDKETGYLRVDRPQLTSSLPPMPYGFIPRTFCGYNVGKLAKADDGDHDPLDICVVSDRPVNRAEVLLGARVIGGICTIDRGQADDKIIAVLDKDPVYLDVDDIEDLEEAAVDRLEHYFSTYKLTRADQRPVEIRHVYGAEHAMKVVQAALDDYAAVYGLSPAERDAAAWPKA